MQSDDIERYGNLRTHQLDAFREATRARFEGKLTSITADVTPGGGKTTMAAVYVDVLLRAGLIDRVLYVVPNNALKQQAKDGFHNPSRGLMNALRDDETVRRLRFTEGDRMRSVGKVVTYQYLANPKNARRVAKWCSKARTLVVFDEVHHLCDRKEDAKSDDEAAAWTRGAEEVEESCVSSLSMSGTLTRGDKRSVKFLRYKQDPGDPSKRLVDAQIKYHLTDALREGAVIPANYQLFDGTRFTSARNMLRLSEASDRDRGSWLLGALNNSTYTPNLIREFMEHFDSYRNDTGHSSSAIIVCHGVPAAERAFNFIRDHFSSQYSACLSLGRDGAEGDRGIGRFRSGQHQVLVTVKKAFEGLDVPRATHLAYLHNTRTDGFLDQVIARVTRVDPNAPASMSPSHQSAYVFAPNDTAMREFIRSRLDKQDAYCEDRDPREKQEREGKGFKRRPEFPWELDPESTLATDGDVYSGKRNELIKAAIKEFPWLETKASLAECLEVARRLGLKPDGSRDAAE